MMSGLTSAVAMDRPSPIDVGTHDDAGLRSPIRFDRSQLDQEPAPAQSVDWAGVDGSRSVAAHEAIDRAKGLVEALPSPAWADADPFDIGAGSPDTIRTLARVIRPLCVGALMAIPTLGPAVVGAIAVVDHDRAMHATEASLAFLNGIPGNVLILIGTLACGYGFARTLEKLKEWRR